VVEAGTEARWKSRYLDVLDAHERLQGDATRRVGELGALIARVSRAFPDAEGKLLSRRLGTLGDALKRRALEPRLSHDVDAIQAQVLDVIEAREREREALMSALREAADCLQGRGAGADFERRLRRFRKSLTSRDAQPPSRLVSTLCEMQAATLAQPAVAPASPRVPAPAAAAPEPDVIAVAGTRAPIDWEAMRTVLRSLLAQVELPAQFRDRIGGIDKRLDSALDEARLLQILVDVRDLFDAAIAAMHGEFRGFLDTVDRRLDSLLGAIGQARADGDATRELERGMAHSMRASLAQMRSDAAGATELAQLQHSIHGHLECLVRSVHEFGRTGESLSQSRDARLEAMATRLQAMEAESREARGQLAAQRRLALTDPLTGLANRLAFDERVAEELVRARRDGVPLAVALGDVDHFKRVNDEFGHQAGDRALVLLARILRKRLRHADFCARYGGEEFVLLLPATAREQAAAVIEQVRAYVAGCGFGYKGVPVPLTMSFGVTECTPEDAAPELLGRADAALYAAKRAGRNQVAIG
jgi:diguanylate cyclase